MNFAFAEIWYVGSVRIPVGRSVFSVYNSAADFSISLKFGKDFDHVTADGYTTIVQGQGHRMT